MLNYELINNGKEEYIVLLHGLCGNFKCFKKQIDSLSKFFNIVLMDMHGHGISSDIHLDPKQKDALKVIVDNIHKTLLNIGIKKAHFMGLSLGTVVINAYALYYPDSVSSIVNVGAVIKFNDKLQRLFKILYKIRKLYPYGIMCSAFANAMMPRKSHQLSREIFIRESKKLDSTDFYIWSKMLITFQDTYLFDIDNKISAFYISGDGDYFFAKAVKKYCDNHNNAKYYQIENGGHICNIDNYNDFNNLIDNIYSNLLETKEL